MKKVGGNGPCPCGSGKKHKNCCLGKKPRTYRLTYDFGHPVGINKVLQTPDGHFFFADSHGIHRPQSVIFDHGYERKSGKFKTLQRISGQNQIFDTNSKLTRFFRCFAVDTNTKIDANINSSTTGVVMGEFNIDDPFIMGRFESICAIQYNNLPPPQEKYGWALSAKLINDNPNRTPDQKMCLIVDSYLDEIDELNQRKKPIISNLYLPYNFEIIYASADAGVENIACKMMREADRVAKKLDSFLLTINEQERAINWRQWIDGIQYKQWTY